MYLQCAHHEKLNIIAIGRGSYPEEHQIHKELAYAHIRGEWFRPTTSVLVKAVLIDER